MDMRRTAGLIVFVAVVALSLPAEQVESFTIVIGNNTDQPCGVYLHYRNGDTWETKGWWTIEARKITALAKSTDTEFFVFIQTQNGYYGTGDKRVKVDPYKTIDGANYAAELPFSRVVAQLRMDEKGNRISYAELMPQTQLRREVIYRDVYLLNNRSDTSVAMSVHYQSLEGTWETTDWEKIGPGQQWLACRTREAEVYAAERSLFVTSPKDAAIKEVKKGLFMTKYYGMTLKTGSPYYPVYIDVIPLFNE
jgi:uncharacterized membrane protein